MKCLECQRRRTDLLSQLPTERKRPTERTPAGPRVRNARRNAPVRRGAGAESRGRTLSANRPANERRGAVPLIQSEGGTAGPKMVHPAAKVHPTRLTTTDTRSELSTSPESLPRPCAALTRRGQESAMRDEHRRRWKCLVLAPSVRALVCRGQGTVFNELFIKHLRTLRLLKGAVSTTEFATVADCARSDRHTDARSLRVRYGNLALVCCGC
jgi:hypothetical protein